MTEAIWTLIPVSAIYGLVAALVFRRFSDEESVHNTLNRMVAHVMEFRFFLDSPALVLRAQRDLMRENLHLLRLMLLPCAILGLIFIILFPQMDAMYGHAPLRAGEQSIVTVQDSADHTRSMVLEAPAGIAIETPAVRTAYDHEVSWRLRPLGRTSGELRIRSDGQMLKQQVVAGRGLIYGWKLPFTHPAIEIRYPRTTILGVSWMVWFFIISGAVATGFSR
jgi:hypothetical protein